MATRVSTLGLYMQILRSLESYPSKNRSSLITGVKLEFRENRKPSTKTEQQIGEARAGLQNILQYSGLSTDRGSDWSVDLEKNPMPKNN